MRAKLSEAMSNTSFGSHMVTSLRTAIKPNYCLDVVKPTQVVDPRTLTFISEGKSYNNV